VLDVLSDGWLEAGSVSDNRTRVLQVRFRANGDAERPWKGGRIRLAAVILYPQKVKRQLRTVETAKARAIELARAIIERDCFRPPNLDALECSAEVVMFDLRPFQRPHWLLEDGTKAWIVEAEWSLPKRGP
jgi:hypothetical protein